MPSKGHSPPPTNPGVATLVCAPDELVAELRHVLGLGTVGVGYRRELSLLVGDESD